MRPLASETGKQWPGDTGRGHSTMPRLNSQAEQFLSLTH